MCQVLTGTGNHLKKRYGKNERECAWENLIMLLKSGQELRKRAYGFWSPRERNASDRCLWMATLISFATSVHAIHNVYQCLQCATKRGLRRKLSFHTRGLLTIAWNLGCDLSVKICVKTASNSRFFWHDATHLV